MESYCWSINHNGSLNSDVLKSAKFYTDISYAQADAAMRARITSKLTVLVFI